MLGTFILWFGWYGFNPGSALVLGSTITTGDIAALCAVNTTLSAASAGVTALFTNLFIEERMTGEAKFDIVILMNGCLGGLVAITAGCAVLEPWAAVIMGVVGGWVYLLASALLIKLRLDDAVDAIPVHLANGLWGVLGVGLLAEPGHLLAAYGTDVHVGWFYSLSRGSFDASLLACQVLGSLFIVGWVFFLMFPFFIWLNYMGWFRADSLEELVGLDISYHGGASGIGGDDVKLEYVEAFNRRKGKAGGPPRAQPPPPPPEMYDQGGYGGDGGMGGPAGGAVGYGSHYAYGGGGGGVPPQDPGYAGATYPSSSPEMPYGMEQEPNPMDGGMGEHPMENH